jgi:hypothetical protein
MFYVYEHIRPDTNAVFYVGKGKGSRINSLSDRNRYWNHIVAKVGSFDVCKIVENEDEELVFLAEQERIDQLKKIGIKLCNITNGGEGSSGRVLSKESREKIRKSALQRIHPKHTEESKEKIRKANTGVVFTEERKRKISEARKGQKMLPHVREALRLGRHGYKHSEEILERMRKIQRSMPKRNCPHCNFVGNAGNVARWHLNNCKLRRIENE